jgi:hypothetical protein
MNTKHIEVNGVSVACAHEAIHDSKTGHTHIELTVQAEDTKTAHRLTIGSVDEPVPTTYGKEQLQAEFEKFRLSCAAMVESRNRIKKLALSIE